MKNKNSVTFVIIAIGWLVFAIGFTFGLASQPTKQIKSENNVVKENKVATEATNKMSNETPKPIETKIPEKTFEAKEYIFGNGNFTVGKDFDKGVYNIVAVNGNGNVICMNAGLNEIMGIKNDGLYQLEYKNIKFGDGNVLEVMNVTIKLIKQNR
jgi:hypothetical protein